MQNVPPTITLSLSRYEALLAAYNELRAIREQIVVAELLSHRMESLEDQKKLYDYSRNLPEPIINQRVKDLWVPPPKVRKLKEKDPKPKPPMKKVRYPPLEFEDGERHCVRCFRTPNQIKNVLNGHPEKKRPATFVPYPPLKLSYVLCYFCGTNSTFVQHKYTPEQIESMIKATTVRIYNMQQTDEKLKLPPNHGQLGSTENDSSDSSSSQKRASPFEENEPKRQCVEVQ